MCEARSNVYLPDEPNESHSISIHAIARCDWYGDTGHAFDVEMIAAKLHSIEKPVDSLE